MIEVKVNGEAVAVPEGTSVATLLDVQGFRADKVAVELNRRLLRSEKYDTTLAAGDVLEVVSFVGGG